MTMQIIKPGKLSLISKTYGYNGHQFAVGVLSFFRLGADNQLLTEVTQWPKISEYLNDGTVLDLGYAKPHGEVLLAGKAFTPGCKPSSKMKVNLAFGKVDKTLKIVGNREWNGGFFAPARKAEPFTEMSLSYQNAYGAAEYQLNPRGKGVIKRQYRDKETGLYQLPNIYSKWDRTNADKAKRQVAGFGPLDISWPQRAKYQGTYDQRWLDEVHPGLPNNTKAKLFNAAPEDQQLRGYIKPGQSYKLSGMHPDKPVIEGNIPDLTARVFISQLIDGQAQFKEIKTSIDTLWFFPEFELGVMIHRGVEPVNDSDGLDVKKLLLACESSKDQPRTIQYYQRVMELRLDQKTAAGHVFNEAQLMPQKTEQQLEFEQQLFAEAKAAQQQKIATIHDLKFQQLQAEHPDLELEKPELPEPEIEEPPPVPQQLLDSGDIDLSPYWDWAEASAAKAKAEMEQQLEEMEQLRKQYQHMEQKSVETIDSMRTRVGLVVHIEAKDLTEQAGTAIPDWLSLLPQQVVIPPQEMEKIQQSTEQLAIAQRQQRQNTPSLTVLPQPLPDEGPALMRKWVKALLEQGVSLAGRDLAGADLSGLVLSGQDLRDVMFERCDLTDCDMSHCKLDGAVFTQANLEQADFSSSSMHKVNLAQSQCKQTCFKQADLSHAILAEAVFSHCDLTGACLNEVLAMAVDMRFSQLQKVNCSKAHFAEANLSHSNWQQASIDNSIFLQPQLQHVNWQQMSLNRTMVLDADAKGANLCGMNANKVQFSNKGDFSKADISAGLWESCGFRGIDLNQGDLRASVFKTCDFGQTRLEQAQINGVLFDQCVMAEASFNDSDCSEVFFHQGSLRKSQFNRVDLRRSEIRSVDVTEMVIKQSETEQMKQTPQPNLGKR